MASDLVERIRMRAYEIWEGNGREGNPEEHWLRAEREVLGNHTAAPESLSAGAAGRNGALIYVDHATKFSAMGASKRK